MTEASPSEAFRAVCNEASKFLRNQAAEHPQKATLIDRVRGEIEAARLPDPLPDPLRLPGFRHFDAAMKVARAGPMADLADAFSDLEPSMRWIRTEHYRDQLGDDYMENYCYANLLGYDALVPHDEVIAAFFIIGPGRHYPRHHHEAEEIYFPFGGDTLWRQGDEAFRERPPAAPIHNTPWLPHEMKTRKTPLFTFCFWVSPGPIKLAQLTQ